MKNGENFIRLQETRDADFAAQVESESGQRLSACYQCGNCTASCAYTQVYDFPANQIIRLVQLGAKDAVLHSRSIWLCAQCQACTTRCPCNLDVASIMETLRVMAVAEGAVSEKDIRLFYDEFLRSVAAFGRVFETGLLAAYNLKSRRLFTDVDLAPRVLRKGKLGLFPPRIRGRQEVAAIVRRYLSGPAGNKSRQRVKTAPSGQAPPAIADPSDAAREV